jgi:hypothetical protein
MVSAMPFGPNVGLRGVVEDDRVRVGDAGGGRRLPDHVGGVGDRRGKQLHRHPPVEYRVECLPHLAHAARPEAADEPVLAELGGHGPCRNRLTRHDPAPQTG